MYVYVYSMSKDTRLAWVGVFVCVYRHDYRYILYLLTLLKLDRTRLTENCIRLRGYILTKSIKSTFVEAIFSL